MNTEPPDNRINCCPSACTIVFNAIYLRECVRVRPLTVNSYVVYITPTANS